MYSCLKRCDSEVSCETASKKLKLSESTPEVEAGSTQDNDKDSVPYAIHVKPVGVSKAESATLVHLGDVSHITAHTEKEYVSNTDTISHNSPKGKVKKKKKKKKREDTEVVTTDPTSTTSTPDHLRCEAHC